MQNVATMQLPEPMELTMDELEQVGGGTSTEWGVATGTAAALTVGAATVTSPLIAGALAVGGLISAGFGIYYAVDEWRND